jgi:alpha-galactosidase
MVDPNAAATLTLDQIDELCADLVHAHGELIPAVLRQQSKTSAPERSVA